MKVGMKIIGADRIARDFEAYAKNVERLAEKKILKWAHKLAADAKRHAPVETGTLRASITAQVEKRKGEIVGAYGTDVPHASYTEFGTETITVGTPENPRTTWAAKERTGTRSEETMPWLRAAWEENKAEINRDLEQIGKQARLAAN